VCVFEVGALQKEAELCHVHVTVNEAWNDGFALGVYDFCASADVFADFSVRAYGDYSTILNGYCRGFWLFKGEGDYVGVQYCKRGGHNQ
jgi:hypothetical protein